MLSYDKQLKALSQHLRKNMTDAENMVWLKLRRKQLKGYPFYRQKIIGKYIVDFYPVRNNAPLGFESQRLEFLTGFTVRKPIL